MSIFFFEHILFPIPMCLCASSNNLNEVMQYLGCGVASKSMICILHRVCFHQADFSISKPLDDRGSIIKDYSDRLALNIFIKFSTSHWSAQHIHKHHNKQCWCIIFHYLYVVNGPLQHFKNPYSVQGFLYVIKITMKFGLEEKPQRVIKGVGASYKA